MTRFQYKKKSSIMWWKPKFKKKNGVKWINSFIFSLSYDENHVLTERNSINKKNNFMIKMLKYKMKTNWKINSLGNCCSSFVHFFLLYRICQKKQLLFNVCRINISQPIIVEFVVFLVVIEPNVCDFWLYYIFSQKKE